MKIFVGSSSKKKRMAQHVAMKLEDAGFQVFRWWDFTVFKGGDITIERLIEMSDICDGSVFIFGADDTILIKERGRTRRLVSPRDNVILEYGMFTGKRGVKRTLFVTEPNVKIPSDLNGVTYLGKKGYADKIVSHFKEVFKNYPKKQSSERITVHASKKLISLLLQGGDKSWVSRSLYVGSRGAKSWAEVESDFKYSGTRDFVAVHRCINKLAEKHDLCSFDCIVSFGPGIGNLDKQIVPRLRGNQLVNYIPVDINGYLANYAADAVDSVSKHIHVPFCIVGDFEEGMSCISEIIHDHTGVGRAFMMLGGTFGNLERGEDTFLQGLIDCMSIEDIAILDIFTAAPKYSLSNDHLLPLSRQPISVRRYIARGIEMRRNIPVAKVAQNVNKYIEFKEISTDEASPIKNTRAFSFVCKETGQNLIYVRRYNFESFKSYLINFGFEIIDAKTVHKNSTTVTRSVFFIRRRA